MLRQGPRRKLWVFCRKHSKRKQAPARSSTIRFWIFAAHRRQLPSEQQLKRQNNQCNQKQQQTQAVDAVHVFYKFCFGPVLIWLAQIQVFGYLLYYSHKTIACHKGTAGTCR